MNEIDRELVSLIGEIKADIVSTRNRILSNANQELISLYFRIGKTVSEKARYGNNFIKTLSTALKIEFPDAEGFSPRNIARMKKFYETYGDLSNLPTALAKLTWSHNCLLIDKISDVSIREWYAEQCVNNGWSFVVLEHQIALKLFERKADNSKKLSNYSERLPAKESKYATDMMKDPYIFEIAGIKSGIVEKDIEKAMLERIRTVLLELGKGFSFVGNQYRISTAENDYYIDLLFYHLFLRCYVIVEIKTTDFKPEYLGQLQFYVTAVDETIKKEQDNPSIGLLLCRHKDQTVVEWALKSTRVPIGVSSYEIQNYLPTENEINKYLDK